MPNFDNSMEDFFQNENLFDQAPEIPNEAIDNFFDNANDEDDKDDIVVENEIIVDESEFDDNELVSRIVADSCGKNESGFPNGAITLSYERRNLDHSVNKVLTSISSNKAELQIYKRVEFVEINLIFKSPVDSDLKLIWNTLERFGREVNLFTETDSNTYPALSLTIVPVEHKGKYYCVCLNPIMWALTSLTAGGQPNTIRIILPAEQIGFFKDEELDMTEIESEALRAIENLENRAEALRKKDYEAQLLQDERNKQLEDLRHK